MITRFTKGLAITGLIMLITGVIGKIANVCGIEPTGVFQALWMSIKMLFKLNIFGALGCICGMFTLECFMLSGACFLLAFGNKIVEWSDYSLTQVTACGYTTERKEKTAYVIWIAMIVIAAFMVIVGVFTVIPKTNTLFNVWKYGKDMGFDAWDGGDTAGFILADIRKLLAYVVAPVATVLSLEQWAIMGLSVKSVWGRPIVMLITLPVYFIIGLAIGYAIVAVISAIIVGVITIWLLSKFGDLGENYAATVEADAIMAGRGTMLGASDKALYYIKNNPFNYDYGAKYEAGVELRNRGYKD